MKKEKKKERKNKSKKERKRRETTKLTNSIIENSGNIRSHLDSRYGCKGINAF